MRLPAAFVIAVLGCALAPSAYAGKLLDDTLTLDRSTLLAQVVVQPPPAYPTMPAPPTYYAPPPTYYAPPPPMRPTRVEMRPRYGLLAAGLAIFGASWIMDISLTYSLAHNPAWEAWIPLIGPLLQTRDGISSNPSNPSLDGYESDGTQAVARFFLVWDFLGQAAGLLMAILGATLWRPTTVYADADLPAPKPPKVQIAIVPGSGGHGHNFALVF